MVGTLVRGCRCATSWCDLDMIFVVAVVTLTFKILSRLYLRNLRTLHWLPIRQHIIFKTLVLVYKYLTTGQHKYFAPYLPLYKSAMNTRRSNPKNLFLQLPFYCSHMTLLSYGMIFHMIYAVLQISPVSKVD